MRLKTRKVEALFLNKKNDHSKTRNPQREFPMGFAGIVASSSVVLAGEKPNLFVRVEDN